MSDKLREVATAICKSRTCEGISCCQWPAQKGRTDCPVKRGAYDDAARDAIEAMRHPTIGMIQEALCRMSRDTNVEGTWYAMIDGALK